VVTYFTCRHSSDLIDLVEQSVDHTTLCLSIFWGFLSPEALAYLEKRRLNHPELVAQFKLGFANRTLAYRLPI
ncbi:hypothetical protein, partial [Photorhabdus sp. RM157S]|uniref:hypothetical protein n=1 Tax=Photorhabdus sp. RM157S TaxID=3342827 RepID=UPI0036D7751D